MTPKRRRWLTALGLFLATTVGGVLAYLLARRARRQRAAALEKVSVAELSARLRREAARQERRIQTRPGRMRWPWGGRRRVAAGLSPRRQEREEAAARAQGESADEQKMAASGDDPDGGRLRCGQSDDGTAADPAARSQGGRGYDRQDPLVGA